MARKAVRSDLQAAREAVRRSEQLAGRKAARMASRPHGYDVRGTELDPRKGEEWINRATMRQLQVHAERLATFRHRRTGWYKAGDGTPIKRQVFLNTRGAVRAYNRKISNMNAKVENIEIPWRGMTVGEIAEMTRPKHSWLESHAGQTMDILSDKFTPKRFLSDKKRGTTADEAAREYMDMLRQSLSGEGQDKRIARMRDQFQKMADVIGDKELMQLADELTDDQMWLAWTADRGLADNVSLTYSMAQHLLRGDGANSTEFYVHNGDSTLERTKEILRGAKTIQVPRYDY